MTQPIKYGVPVDLSGLAVVNLVLESLSSAPGSPTTGRAYFDTGLGKARIWYGGAWQNLDNVPASGTITDAMVSASAAIAESKLALATDGTAATGTRRTLGTGSQQAFPGNGRLDQVAAPTSAVSLNGQRITNLNDPSLGTDAATKQYVDNARAGITGIKDPVRVTATANVTISSPGTTIDTVTMANGDRVLLSAQTTGTENGIYVFNGSAAAMTRSTDTNTTGEVLDGTLVAVAEGNNAGSQYIQTATPSGAPGAWTQTWVKFSTGGTVYSAGTGLTLASNTFSIENGGVLTAAHGGTGVTSLAALKTALGVPSKFVSTISSAFTAGTPVNVVHSLGTEDLIVGFTDTGSGGPLMLSWTPTDNNTIAVTSNIAIAANGVKAVVVG